jgi:hypothetical protein
VNTSYVINVRSSVLGTSLAAAGMTFAMGATAAAGVWSIATAAGDVDRPKHTHQGSPPRELDPV